MKAHLHILSAEDQRLYAEMVSTLFEDAGHIVVTAEDGQEAMDLAAMAKFDLLVTDHKMPRVDGLVLVTRLKEWREESALVGARQGRRCRDRGACDRERSWRMVAPGRRIARDGR